MFDNLPRRTFLKHLVLGGSLTPAYLASDAAGQQTEAEQQRGTPKRPQMTAAKMPKPAYLLPALPYPYNGLEPYIDERTVHIHYDKHHTGYVKKFNMAVADRPDLASQPIEDLLAKVAKLSPEMQPVVRHNGAGAYNHTLFWKCMAPSGAGGGGEPQGKLAEAIKRDLGGWPAFKDAFSKAAATQFASGWAWLAIDKDGKLFVCSTPNHDNPLMTSIVDKTGEPILTLDIWEHAYYLKYQNRRADYITAWWNVVNWTGVADRFAEAKHTPVMR